MLNTFLLMELWLGMELFLLELSSQTQNNFSGVGGVTDANYFAISTTMSCSYLLPVVEFHTYRGLHISLLLAVPHTQLILFKAKHLIKCSGSNVS